MAGEMSIKIYEGKTYTPSATNTVKKSGNDPLIEIQKGSPPFPLLKFKIYKSQLAVLQELAFVNNMKAEDFLSGQFSEHAHIVVLKGYITRLDLDMTAINDIRPLRGNGLSKLRKAHFRHTELSDISPLEGSTNLRELRVEGSKVTKEQAQALKKKLPQLYIDILH
ncbi:MAG: hypothetical protein ABH860_00580 [bacterium]